MISIMGAVIFAATAATIAVSESASSISIARYTAPPPTSTAIQTGFSEELEKKQEDFNRNLPLTVDKYTTLQRVDFKRGYWTFHFVVSYYINKVKEFEDKKHATVIGTSCMDKAFVRSLKETGPFLYQYLDPSGQTADVTIPKDDCGE